MWFDEAVIYQIYPLGLCGAPKENDGVRTPRILRLLDWVDHIKRLGADTVPVSYTHLEVYQLAVKVTSAVMVTVAPAA